MHSSKVRFLARVLAFCGAAALATALTACNGTSGNPFTPGGGSAKLRFFNGSPDAGAVDVFIDSTAQFNTPTTPINYGGGTGYLVNLKAGSHTIVIYQHGNDTGSGIYSTTIAVNNGSKYSIVLAGEQHPRYTSTPTLGVLLFAEQPYNTPGGGAAVNFHNAAPETKSFGAVQFGYYLNNAPATNPLGPPVALGSASNPIGLSGAQLGSPITFYAESPSSGVTAKPSQFSTHCGNNVMPCDTGNLSLYLVDGPLASTAPKPPFPSGVTVTTPAFFIGQFDSNG